MKPQVLGIFILLCYGSLRSQDSKLGGVFTPQGTLRALVVPVVFQDQPTSNPDFLNKNHELQGWNLHPNQLPDAIDPISGKSISWLYNDEEDFNQLNFEDGINDSELFYLESKGNFKMIFDFFRDSTRRPQVIRIDPEGGKDWSHMNAKALEKMQEINPNFALASFDQRKNRPDFKFDNLQSKADSIVDYIIFVYRYSPKWTVQPALGMNRWIGSGGGFASPSGIQLETWNGFRFSEGFTMMFGSGVFVHEIAHTLYNAPHLWGSNNTVGDYFFRPTVGWGPTATISVFKGFNAWEKWYMGWNEISHDLQVPEFGSKPYLVQLNDFYTSGQSLRIPIPFSKGQNLWIENHQGKSHLDHHIWKNYRIGADSLTDTPKGYYAYVENISSDQKQLIQPLSGSCNGLKLLNASGNFDYHVHLDDKIQNDWGNNLYLFEAGEENPYGGSNPLYFYRYDFNQNGVIELDPNYNSGKNEGEAINRLSLKSKGISNSYLNFGLTESQWPLNEFSPAFQMGRTLSAVTNPPLIPHVKYDRNAQKMNFAELNGLQIRFVKLKNQECIQIENKAIEVKKDLRCTGYLSLSNLSNDKRIDLIIHKSKQMIIDESKTPNRHTKNKEAKFVNPSLLLLKKGSTIELKRKAKIYVKSNSTLSVEEAVEFKLARGSKIILEPGANFEDPFHLVQEKFITRKK